jgi:putative protein-disulfide isomerase
VSDQKQLQEKTNNQEHIQEHADRVKIIYYTDPLCCWSWAFEPQWRRFRYEFRDHIAFEYRMGGLISNWNNYNDTVNSISRPLQMGPLWMQAHYMSGMPVKDRIWMYDPPQSSYPACVAVKCAGLQSRDAEEKFLRYAREAVMIKGLNIARQNVLFEIAGQLNDEINFNAHRFKEDYTSGAGIEPFKKDLQQVQYKNINRFPTLTISNSDKGGVIVTGYRSYDSLLDVIKNFIPLTQLKPIVTEDYKNYYTHLTEREIEEATKPLEQGD